MGMSTHVVGFKPPDEKFKRMLKAWRACKDAGVDPPEEVVAFFGDDEPDEAGVEVRLLNRRDANCTDAPGVKRYEDGDTYASGFEIDLRELDPDVKILRFYNSW